MYNFDASSIIHAWDNYPIDNPLFDSLWNWFSNHIHDEEFIISKIAFDEVNLKIPECGQWLRENNIKIYILSRLSLFIAKNIKDTLEIIEEQYHKGVGENDLFIIAISKEIGAQLVSEEAIQNPLPKKKSKYKIPAVCNLSEVQVSCVNFLSLLK